MSVTCFVFGSYTASCRPLVLRGNKTAEGWLEPSLQNAGFSLGRILEASYSRTLLQRMLGCGRLEIATAGQRGVVVIDDVPHVEDVQRVIYALVEAAPRGMPAAGPAPGPATPGPAPRPADPHATTWARPDAEPS